jgi:ribosomal protein S27AE
MKKNKVRVPPMLAAVIQNALIGAEGHEFTHLPACPHCGGPVSGYDSKSRKFVTLVENDTTRDIIVRVKRYRCSRCGRVSPAQSPFYPDTRVGSPVVDLCTVLAEEMPLHRVAKVMRQLGIQIDRGSVRNYAMMETGHIPTTNIFGIRIPDSVMSLSIIAARRL